MPDDVTPGPPRCVVLLGHPGAGTSTLVAALAAAPLGRTPPGAAGEVVAWPLQHRSVDVVLLDAPGQPEGAAGVQAALDVADALLLVVSATDGVDARAPRVWAAGAAAGLPRAVVVTGLDRPGADVEEVVAICRRVLGEGVLAVALPLLGGDSAAPGGVDGLLTLLDLCVHDHSGDAVRQRPADPEHREGTATARADLVEELVTGSEDDTLLDHWLDGVEPGAAELQAELEAATGRAELHPVLPVAAGAGVGLPQLRALLAALPAPGRRSLPAAHRPDGSPVPPLSVDAAGPLAGRVLRAGPDALVRVVSGTLRPGDALRVGLADRHVEVTAGGLVTVGPTPTPMPACPAGALCVVGGLAGAAVGDTLSRSTDPLVLAGRPAEPTPW